ncbi:MAG: hypothetical protein ACUVQP_10815 [Bacteroidales bacterium]
MEERYPWSWQGNERETGTIMVLEGYQVSITPGKIVFGDKNDKSPNSGGFFGFQIQVTPQVKPNTEQSEPTVFFVLPENTDTVIIVIPDKNNERLYQFFVNRTPQLGAEGEGWNNFSYPPAAIAHSHSQKSCTNLKEFSLFLQQLQQQKENPENDLPENDLAVSLDFPPGSDMAKILSAVSESAFSSNEIDI